MNSSNVQRIKIINPELQRKIRKAIEDKERLFAYDSDSLERIKLVLSAKA
ncbi:MAG: hypothetical protein MUC87_10080 [Bacteroidia bacterium]|jgi:hypothetical protein|nr:hypothetical protein [Bacteroidia bacterium]